MNGRGLWIEFTATGADLSSFLDICLKNGVELHGVRYIDEMSVRFILQWKYCIKLRRISEKLSVDLVATGKNGIFWSLVFLLKRPCLVTGVLALFILTLWLPTKVLFVEVEGNQKLPSKLVLEAAAQCGIDFGAARGYVRSEKVKNSLLEKIPQLQWAGINTSGCVAVISVREREEIVDSQDGFAYGNIVAAKDGIVLDCTVEKGDLVCKVGQAVQSGQVLVSGYRDNGLTITATKPIAEVYAMTVRECRLISPDISYKREVRKHTEINYYLQIGEKYIKFNNSSGIYDTTCVKIYDKKVLILPGGFHLPISLVKVTNEYYTLACPKDDEIVDHNWMQQAQQSYLLSIMTAGRVLSYESSVMQENGYSLLTGTYRCVEMIGQFKQEEIVQ